MPHSSTMADRPVPVIDVSPFFNAGTSDALRASVVDQVREACEHVGFMIIVGHGVPQDVIQEAWTVTLHNSL